MTFNRVRTGSAMLICLFTIMLCSVLPVAFSSSDCLAGQVDTVRIGFLEGGLHYAHVDIRKQIRDQLKWLATDEYYFEYPANGFKTADWKRDSCRQMAADLNDDSNVDLVVALGAWAAEDLLEVGFKRPIIVGYRFDPAAEGLIGANGRPIAENLAVRQMPHRIELDLSRIKTLLAPDTIGLLYFPSGNSNDTVVAKIKAIASQLGIVVKESEGYDRLGTFAFFNAYKNLDKKVDLVYTSPLWGFNAEKNRQWYQGVYRDNLPVYSSEGETQATYGAMACGNGEDPAVAARYICWQIMQILHGATPADLKTVFIDHSTLIINDFLANQYGASIPDRLRETAMQVEAPPGDDAERLALPETIALAYTNNPDYRAEIAAAETATHEASRAKSTYLPQIAAEADLSHYDDNAVYNDSRYKNERFRAGLTLNQPLFSLDKIRRIQRAGREQDLAGIDLKTAALDLETDVTIAFIDYLQAEQLRLVEKTYRRLVMRAFQLASSNAGLDEMYQTDATRLEGEWARASQLQEEALTATETARINLNRVMGRPGELRFESEAAVFAIDRIRREILYLTSWNSDSATYRRGMDFLQQEAASQSPELRYSETMLAIQEFRRKEASARFWPQVGFRASLDHTEQLEESGDFTEKSPSWSVGASVSLPLWLGGDRFKNRSAMKARYTELELRYEAARQSVRADLQSQVELLMTRAKNANRLAYRAELSARNIQPVLDQYVAGKLSLVRLLDALQERREAVRQSILNQFDYSRAAARLLRKTGWSAYETGLTPSALLVSRLSSLKN